MKKIVLWCVLFIIGIVMILGASEFSRYLANDLNWCIAGTILSVISGLGMLFEIYFKKD